MNREQLEVLRKLASDKEYGRGPNHANQVKRLSLKIYDEFVRLGVLQKPGDDKQVLETAALLHDIGLFKEPHKEPHNEVAFDFLSATLPRLMANNPLTMEESSTILYCVLWHRGARFAQRGAIHIADLSYTKKVAAILRVGDALDRTLQQLMEDVSLRVDGGGLIFTVLSKYSVETEINRAKEKADLMKEAYTLTGVGFEHASNK
ncbi:MAG: HD domain-containing protein [Dehalococcoidales bacterium]|nr:HD domain-containing protein [Dehalococcoidales bacterium]